jgi:hypothetical protein
LTRQEAACMSAAQALRAAAWALKRSPRKLKDASRVVILGWLGRMRPAPAHLRPRWRPGRDR